MPIRIYALAKELDIDSKELVDICTKAGVTGKGSALASLTDEEVAKVKSHLAGKTAAAPSRAAPSRPASAREVGTPVRPNKPGMAPSKPPMATKAPSSKPTTSSSSPLADRTKSTDSEPDEQAPIPVTPEPAPAPIPAAQQPASPKPAAPKPRKVGYSRDDYMPVGGAGGKPPIAVVRQKSDPDRKKSDGGKPPAKREPVVRVAASPQGGQAPTPPKAKEERTQKPIMTLPADAISRAKAGGRAPLEQFTKKEDSRRAEKTTERRGKAVGGRGGAAGRGHPDVPPSPDEPLKPGSAIKKDRRARTGGAEAGTGDGEGKKKLAGMASARASRQQKRKSSRVSLDDDGETRRRSRRRLTRRGGTNTAAPRKENVVVDLPCTVRSLSEASGVPTMEIQKALMAMGTMATINAEMDPETAEMIAADLGMEIEFRQQETLEDTLLSRFEAMEDDPDSIVSRPPIITFLGHVDHGKTSLLDRIIGIDVVKGEAGGITQHIRAYKIKKDGREIAFVDTPGHEAFTEMRARGANVTDIAVLVVAADDGVMPQTEEAISHARAANVPIVVALNKVDLPGADLNKALQDLSTHGLLPTEWGGDVEVIKTSAITGDGIDDLLETLLLTAEIHEYTANPKRDANGICLEAQQDGDRGVVAKMIVKNGTLRVGDVVVCGGAYGKVKSMDNTLHTRKRIKQAGPSTPVSVTGLDIAPQAGEPFYVLDDIAKARAIAAKRKDRTRSKSLSGQKVRVSFEEFQERLLEGRLVNPDEVVNLNLILRADVRGSIEAIQKELEKLDHDEVKINILQASVGGVTSADVTLADASNAVIVGFNVIPDENARSLAEQRGVQIRRYDIIYKVTEDLKLMLEGRLKPEKRVADLGRALVQRLFTISRTGTIAGCRVLAGKIERGSRIRVNRDGRGIGDYPLDSLKRDKDDAKEVREGFECGMKLLGFNDLKEGDVLEAYKIEEVKRTL